MAGLVLHRKPELKTRTDTSCGGVLQEGPKLGHQSANSTPRSPPFWRVVEHELAVPVAFVGFHLCHHLATPFDRHLFYETRSQAVRTEYRVYQHWSSSPSNDRITPPHSQPTSQPAHPFHSTEAHVSTQRLFAVIDQHATERNEIPTGNPETSRKNPDLGSGGHFYGRLY